MKQPGARLELRGVAFRYTDQPVLAEIDLCLRAGEMAALLGPNGSGKSTLLNLAAGVLQPQLGTLHLDDRDLRYLDPRERGQRIAMVPQAPVIPMGFTVRELVALGRTPYLHALRGETAADQEAVRSALGHAGIEALSDRPLAELSGGERQRAALALAFAQQPSLLLLDEPTAHLDLHHQMMLLGLVRRLNRCGGLTVLAAIHDVNLAALWFDRLLLLQEGRLAADGVPWDVLKPELIERVFGHPVRVMEHPTTGVPLVALERGEAQSGA